MSYGYKSYLIAGKQTNWDTPAILSEMTGKIYEVTSMSIRNTSDLILPERFKGQPSPTEGIENIVDVTGDIVMHLHADDMLFWWEQIMYDTADTTASDDKVLYPAGGWTSPISLTTQPNDTSPRCDPAVLKFTFSESKTGWIRIAGKGQNGESITETITLSSQTTKSTSKQFTTVDANGITTNITRTGSETLEIKGNKNVYTHVLALGDDLPSGFTTEVSKGGIPSVYVGGIVGSATINLADVITLTMGILAKQGYNSCKLSTSGTNRTPVASETPSSTSGFTRISSQVYPAWGIQVELDTGGGSVVYPVSSLTLTIDNNLRYLDRYSGSRFRTKPVRAGNRNYSMRIGIDYNTNSNDFDEIFHYAQEISAKVTAYRKPGGGAEYKLEITMPRCQLTSYPDPAVTDYAEIVQELILRPLRTIGATSSDELGVTLQCVSNV